MNNRNPSPLDVPCPTCGADIGVPCEGRWRDERRPHWSRRMELDERQAYGRADPRWRSQTGE